MTDGPFDVCPICGGELKKKKVEKLIKGGNDTATLMVEAEICLRCGERLYTKKDIQKFESIRRKLIEHDIGSLQPVGRSYQVA